MAGETVFLLLLTSALPLLHLAQGTACQGDNCTTGDYDLEINQQNHGIKKPSTTVLDHPPEIKKSAK